jgi:hypothetical protein
MEHVSSSGPTAAQSRLAFEKEYVLEHPFLKVHASVACAMTSFFIHIPPFSFFINVFFFRVMRLHQHILGYF